MKELKPCCICGAFFLPRSGQSRFCSVGCYETYVVEHSYDDAHDRPMRELFKETPE